jgi:hypothetical protein
VKGIAVTWLLGYRINYGCKKSLHVNITNFTRLPYFIEYSCALFYIENDAEIFPVHYTLKVAEKGFKNKMAFIMYKLAIINSCEIILEK